MSGTKNYIELRDSEAEHFARLRATRTGKILYSRSADIQEAFQAGSDWGVNYARPLTQSAVAAAARETVSTEIRVPVLPEDGV